MFRLAVHDDNVYSSIRKAMPAGACAAIFFDKVQKQSRNLLVSFDEYRRTGLLPRGHHSLEVKDVAAELQRHVEQIRVNLLTRVPYGTKGAAEALLALLQDISARNIDAFEQSPWGRQPPPGEDEDDRNLYEQLIGQNAAAPVATATGAEGSFVLDVLESLPASVLASYISTLTDILGKVEIARDLEMRILACRFDQDEFIAEQVLPRVCFDRLLVREIAHPLVVGRDEERAVVANGDGDGHER